MSWLWIPGALFALVAVAAILEAWARRGTHRPLSSHAINQRRWDDPNRPEQDQSHHVMQAETGVGFQGLSGKREWRVAKDPHEQARILMPDDAKKRKDNE